MSTSLPRALPVHLRWHETCFRLEPQQVESQLEGVEVAGGFRVHLGITSAGNTSQAAWLHAECEASCSPCHQDINIAKCQDSYFIELCSRDDAFWLTASSE